MHLFCSVVVFRSFLILKGRHTALGKNRRITPSAHYHTNQDVKIFDKSRPPSTTTRGIISYYTPLEGGPCHQQKQTRPTTRGIILYTSRRSYIINKNSEDRHNPSYLPLTLRPKKHTKQQATRHMPAPHRKRASLDPLTASKTGPLSTDLVQKKKTQECLLFPRHRHRHRHKYVLYLTLTRRDYPRCLYSQRGCRFHWTRPLARASLSF